MRRFIESITREAGAMALGYGKRLSVLKVERKRPTDLVTEADKAVEDYLRTEIARRHPDHGIMGEERSERFGKGRFRWVIDPIDGTTSFVHGQPFYSVSVALQDRGQTVLGAVYAPALGEFYLAEKGRGAFLNRKRIRVSSRDRLIDSVLATGFACVRAGLSRNNLPLFAAVITRIQSVRRYGSAAMDLCYTASGRLEGFWELCLRPYDVAAGILILTEAGGRVSDLSGGSGRIPDEVVATNGRIHRELIGILGRAMRAAYPAKARRAGKG